MLSCESNSLAAPSKGSHTNLNCITNLCLYTCYNLHICFQMPQIKVNTQEESKPDTPDSNNADSKLLKLSSHEMIDPGDLSGSVFISQPTEDDDHSAPTHDTKDKFNIRVAIMPAMILFCLSIMINLLGIGLVYQCLPPLAEEYGISKSVIAIALGAGGVLEIPCRILNGYIADKHIVSAYTQYIVTKAMAGGIILVGNLVQGLPGMYLELQAFIVLLQCHVFLSFYWQHVVHALHDSTSI